MDREVTLIGMGTGLPGRTNTALEDDKHTALDLWQLQKATWDQVLQVSEIPEYQTIVVLRLMISDTSTGAGHV